MKTFKILCLTFISCVSLASAQTEYNYSDELLTNTFKTYQLADIELSDHILPYLQERFLEELQDTTSFSNPYDSLSNYVAIKYSKNKLLKLYSYTERNYGCRWLASTLAQFKTVSGAIKTVNFDEIASEIDEDLYVLDMQQISINNEPHYLVIGIGGHCGNQKYSVARVYKIVNEALVLCNAIFKDKSELDAGSNRSKKVEMKYDPEREILSYNKYNYDDDRGGYGHESTIEQWKLSKTGFKLMK